MAILQVNQRFGSISDFKEALRNWAVADGFDFRWQFSDNTCAKANCVHHPSCKFTVQCNYYAQKAIAQITVLAADHNCTGNPTVPRSQASRLDWLLGALPLILTVDTTTTTKSIIDAINLHHSHTIEQRQAQCVQNAILEVTNEKLVVDYTKILAYIQALVEVR